jgi:hypothetical protein
LVIEEACAWGIDDDRIVEAPNDAESMRPVFEGGIQSSRHRTGASSDPGEDW